MHYERKTLPNGLRVIACEMPNTDTVTVLTLIGTGSHYETRDINGISHYLEHMFFKGTKKYPDASALNRRIDAIGGVHNAFTSKEETGYWVKAHKDHFHTAFGFVSDILQNALIPTEEVERERNVIFEEMKLYWDTPSRYIWDLFEHHYFGDQPAGWDIIGTKETLESLHRPQLMKYWKAQYVASNTVLVVAGNIKADAVFALARKEFKSLRKGKASPRKPLQAIAKGPRVKVHQRATDQTHLVVGTTGLPYAHKDRVVADVLATILGGYMTSRLFIKIRERRGLAYTVSAGHQYSPQAGYMAVYAGIPQGKYAEVAKYIVDEFRAVVKKGVTTEELKRAKANVRGRMAIALESTDEVASFFGSQEVMVGDIKTPDAILAKVDKVTNADIKRVAAALFKPSQLYAAIIGNDVSAEKLTSALQ
jgi:predicted Zn-dependent peptidase